MDKKIAVSVLAMTFLIFSPGSLVAYDQDKSMVKISGDFGSSFGVTSDKFYWKQANANYQEKNWRYVFSDEGVNTYDQRVYSRFRLEIETDTNSPWNAYAEIVVDPWSVTGIAKERVYNDWGDYADVQYKYWSATGSVINEMYRTRAGNVVSFPELKVSGHQVSEHTSSPDYWGSPPMTFSPGRSTKIDYFFRPVRKLWFEYDDGTTHFKVFPYSDQTEALTTDDPLRLSNNRMYYAPSPWLFSFDPGMSFDEAQTPSIELAKWNWDLAWFAQDSNRQYLTRLRGMTFGYDNGETMSFKVTGATPQTPWEYYDEVTSVPIAARAKFHPFDGLELGVTNTSKMGISKKTIKGYNQVWGVDAAYDLDPETQVFGQYAGSFNKLKFVDGLSERDLGSAFQVGVRSSLGYNREDTVEWDTTFTYMGEDFIAGLSDYRDTRRDLPWHRHVWFDPMTEEEEAFRIGDSIDNNRYVIGANVKASLMGDLVRSFLNVRSAHQTSTNKLVENIVRFETEYNPLANLSIKGLALYRKYPDTLGNKDPLIRDRYRDELLFNYQVQDGQNVEITTFSGGAKYDFWDGKASIYGIFEVTNDPQDFPREVFRNQGDSMTLVRTDGGSVENVTMDQLYGQNIFGLAPFGYYNIYKGVVTVRPVEQLLIRYEHVTNGNRNYAALIDNNHTHDSIEISYDITDNIRLDFGYSMSRVIDLKRALDTGGDDRQFRPHHNLYSQLDLKLPNDQRLTFMFGEAWIRNEAEGGVFGTRWPATRASVLETVSIFRVYYQGKF